MEEEKTFAHPALCPLEALCATANNDETWTCQSNYVQIGACYSWTDEDTRYIAQQTERNQAAAQSGIATNQGLYNNARANAESSRCQDFAEPIGSRSYSRTPDPTLPGCGGCSCCYNYEISMPAKCDAEDNPIMLWGRQTRATSETDTGNAACTDDSMCQDAEKSKCYAHQCVKEETPGDTTRNWAYINGACATISPHAVAKVSVTAENITIECLINTETGNIDTNRHYPNRYNDVVDNNDHDYFNNMLVNRYGQIVPEDDFDELTLPVRAFDTRAKAQACMLCSLYTARNPDKVAYIVTGEFAKCTIYSDTLDTDGEKCVDLFGDNIFVAREGYKEVETLDPDDERPAYLLTGMVPTDVSKGWAPFGLMPPLFNADGTTYLDSPLQKHLMPQFGGIYESFNRPRYVDYKREPTEYTDWYIDSLIPWRDYLKRTENFAILWDFVSCATVDDYSETKAAITYPWDANIFYRPGFKQIYFEEETPSKGFSNGRQSFVPQYLCKWQPSYCCTTGVENASFTEITPGGDVVELTGRCGHFNELSYGLNHPYRATRCEKWGGNFARQEAHSNYVDSHWDSLTGTGNQDTGFLLEHFFAADVLMVPRTYNTAKKIYGWAREEDLYDIDRTAWNENGCKYRPGQKDYCLRRDRGRGSSTATPLGSYCHQRGAEGFNLMATDAPVAICTNLGTDSEDCLAYVDRDFVSPTTTPTTSPPTFTAAPIVITPRDAMLYFAVYGVGGAHFRYQVEPYQSPETVSWPAQPKFGEYGGPSARNYNSGNPGLWAYQVFAADPADTNASEIYVYKSGAGEKNSTISNLASGTTYYLPAISLSSYYWSDWYAFAYENPVEQKAPIYIAYHSTNEPQSFEMAVVYPVGATRGSCGVYYRYRPTEAPDNLISYTYTDAGLSAHTECRDFCTAWHACIAYSFAEGTCKLYSRFWQLGEEPYQQPLPFEWYLQNDAFGNNIYHPYTTYWGSSSTGERIDEALRNNLAANVKRETEFDSNALHRDTLPATVDASNATYPPAFDLYYGYSFCNTTGDLNSFTRRGRTLQQCIYEAGTRNASAFIWYGRLDGCLLYTDAFQGEIVVANAEPNPPQGPLGKCNAQAYGTTVEIGIQQPERGESIPVLGVRSEDDNLFCPQIITTTTTTKTVASLAPVGVEKAAYGIDQRLCGTDEPRWIYPVFERSEVPEERILSTGLEVEGHDLVIDTGRPFTRPCPETQPDGLVLVNAPNETTATSTPGTSPTTTTRTFVNEFTEADTAVTIGVVAGVLGTGVVLIALRLRFPVP